VRAGRPLSVGGRLTRILVLLLAGVALVAALGVAASLARGSDAQSTWRMQSPVQPRHTGVFRNPRLTESSGVAASRRQPGVLWTLNDSGNEPWIFATDTLGGDLGTFRVTDADNHDWEAIALGPCGRRECLYIADTGDNGEGRGEVRIYRVPEPALPAGSRATSPAEVLRLRYPDGPRDVEAAFVGGDETVFLISKGLDGTARAYRVPARAWAERGPVVAEALGDCRSRRTASGISSPTPRSPLRATGSPFEPILPCFSSRLPGGTPCFRSAWRAMPPASRSRVKASPGSTTAGWC
jgi:hypothetical protein